MNNLEEELTCKYHSCHKFYLEPVILPCGNSICDSHICELSEFNTVKIFKCEFCEEIHEIPENGFVLNKNLNNILKLNLHLTEKGKEANELIQKFETILNELVEINKDPENFIFDYVSRTRNKIDLEREKLLVKINQISEHMLEKLNEFENQCKSHLTSLSELVEKNKILADDLKLQFLKFKDNLRSPKFDNTRMDQLVDDLNKFLTDTEAKLIDYKNELFVAKSCYFIPKNLNFSDEQFGEFNIGEFKNIHLFEGLTHFGLLESKILTASKSFDLVKLCGFSFKDKFILVYRATDDGFDSHDFHKKVDGVSKTLTIIKVRDSDYDYIFGGYAEIPWDSCGGKKEDDNAFVFSLVNRDNKPIKFTSKSALYFSSDYGPIFRGATYNDFSISAYSNINEDSVSNLGHNSHKEITSDIEEANKFLAGSHSFTTSEIEVFQRITF